MRPVLVTTNVDAALQQVSRLARNQRPALMLVPAEQALHQRPVEAKALFLGIAPEYASVRLGSDVLQA